MGAKGFESLHNRLNVLLDRVDVLKNEKEDLEAELAEAKQRMAEQGRDSEQ